LLYDCNAGESGTSLIGYFLVGSGPSEFSRVVVKIAIAEKGKFIEVGRLPDKKWRI
jgi:hypothetical protein